MKADIIMETISLTLQNYNGRQLVIWGKCNRSKTLEDKLKAEYGLSVAYYVDTKADVIRDERVQSINSLKGQKDRIYVICVLRYFHEIYQQLVEWGYEKSADFAYLSYTPTAVENVSEYRDGYGNKIIGDIGKAKVLFYGYNSLLTVDENFNAASNVTINMYDDSSLTIGKNVTIQKDSDWYCMSKSNCVIDENTIFSRGGILRCGKESKILIERNNWLGMGYLIVSGLHTEIKIGKDCLWSRDVFIRANDGHSIFDIHTGKNINSDSESNYDRKVILGDHVWVGARATIMYGADIGNGSVVGAGSFVKKTYPNNCIIAGNPARVIRKDIAWSMEDNAVDMSVIDDEYIKYTDNK
ncbi:MAG TPA: acyltransferase [Clostridia bacterium]|nr:acyltransferase [Clostridia bacterium]